MPMISRRSLIFFLTVFLIAALSFSLAFALTNFKPGDRLPEITIQKTDGSEFVLSESSKAKLTILIFWKKDQRFSKKALADMERIRQEFKDEAVAIIAVNADNEPVSEVKEAADSLEMKIPAAIDPDRELYGKLGVIVLPSTLIIGPDNKLVYYRGGHNRTYHGQIRSVLLFGLGKIDGKELEAALNPKKLEKTPAPQKESARYLRLAQKLILHKKTDKAIEALKKAIAAQPGSVTPKLLLARLYLKTNKIEDAADLIEQALKTDPRSKEAKLVKGLILSTREDYAGALEILTALVKINPQPPPEALFEIGKIYELQGRQQEAIEIYRKALELLLAR